MGSASGSVSGLRTAVGFGRGSDGDTQRPGSIFVQCAFGESGGDPACHAVGESGGDPGVSYCGGIRWCPGVSTEGESDGMDRSSSPDEVCGRLSSALLCVACTSPSPRPSFSCLLPFFILVCFLSASSLSCADPPLHPALRPTTKPAEVVFGVWQPTQPHKPASTTPAVVTSGGDEPAPEIECAWSLIATTSHGHTHTHTH